MICKGAALNIVFLAGDSEGLEAWRQLTEKYEPNMRTRFAGQLMSILSFSFQGDTTDRITAWEREIVMYERDSGKTLDDEIKVGTVLLRLPESPLKNPFADAYRQPEKVDRLQRRSGLRFLVRLPLLRHSRHRWTLEQWARVNQARVVRERKTLANVTIRLRKHVSGAETRDHTSTNCPHSDTTCRKCGQVGHLAQVCRSSGTPQPKGGQTGKGGGKCANVAKTCWNC